MSEFHKRLKDLRKEQDKSQMDIAEILDITRATVSAYETEKIMPPYEKIKFLADYFGVSVQYLTGESNSRVFEKESNNIDIAESLKKLTASLRDETKTVLIGGVELEPKVRLVLINSIENVLNMAETLK